MLMSVNSYSQKDKTIYATANKNTNIFFQSPIKTAIVGSSTFSFGYNRDEKSTYGILKAIPGLESNLLVTTDNGNIFSFSIRYKKDIAEINYFINDSLAIGNINGKRILTDIRSTEDTVITKTNNTIIIDPVTVNDYEISPEFVPKNSDKIMVDYTTDRMNYYKKYCAGELDKEKFYKRFYKGDSNVFLRLKNITYDKDELYFTLIIDNKSTLDYDVEDLSFYLTARNKTRRTSTQRIAYEAKYIHENPTRIDAKSVREVVFVFKKFSFNTEKVLIISLTEFKGERNIHLEIPNSNINNPN